MAGDGNNRRTQEIYLAAIELLLGNPTRTGGKPCAYRYGKLYAYAYDPTKVVPLDVVRQRDVVRARGAWIWVEVLFVFSIVCVVVQRFRDMICSHCRKFCGWDRCIHTMALRIKKGLFVPESWVRVTSQHQAAHMESGMRKATHPAKPKPKSSAPPHAAPIFFPKASLLKPKSSPSPHATPKFSPKGTLLPTLKPKASLHTTTPNGIFFSRTLLVHGHAATSRVYTRCI